MLQQDKTVLTELLKLHVCVYLRTINQPLFLCLSHATYTRAGKRKGEAVVVEHQKRL